MIDAGKPSQNEIAQNCLSATDLPLSARSDLAARSVLLAGLTLATLMIAVAATVLDPPREEDDAADRSQHPQSRCTSEVTEAEFQAWAQRLLARRAFGSIVGQA